MSTCHLPTSSAITIAVTPVITPAERSNSPPIINRPTGTATIPKNAACWVQAATPVCLSHRWLELASVIANITNTNIAAEQRAELRAPERAGESADRNQPFVLRRRGSGGVAIGGEVALIVPWVAGCRHRAGRAPAR